MLDQEIIKGMASDLKRNGATDEDLKGFGFESKSMEIYKKRGGAKDTPIKQLALEIRRAFRKTGEGS